MPVPMAATVPVDSPALSSSSSLPALPPHRTAVTAPEAAGELYEVVENEREGNIMEEETVSGDEELYASADHEAPAHVHRKEADLNDLIDSLALEDDSAPQLPPPRAASTAFSGSQGLEHGGSEDSPNVIVAGADDMYNMHLPFAPQVQQQLQMQQQEQHRMSLAASSPPSWGGGSGSSRPPAALPPSGDMFDEADAHVRAFQEDIYDEMESPTPAAVASTAEDMYNVLPPTQPVTTSASFAAGNGDVAPALPSKSSRAAPPAMPVAQTEMLYGVPSGAETMASAAGNDLYSVLPPQATSAPAAGEEEYNVLPPSGSWDNGKTEDGSPGMQGQRSAAEERQSPLVYGSVIEADPPTA